MFAIAPDARLWAADDLFGRCAHDVAPSALVKRLRYAFSCLQDGTVLAQALYASGVEAQLTQDLLGVLAQAGRAPG